MKKITLIICLLLAGILTKATPLSGTYTIPGSYASIAAAFADLNANGVDGPCVFLINANYTETALSLTLTVPTASAAFPITFKKDPGQTGANPKIIVSAGTTGSTDGGIIIAGTDYVTFEKLDIDASAETTIEWGYALVKRQNVAPFDGCQHVTITGCNITLNKVNTKAIGIYSGNHIATATTTLTITATTDASNDCSFDYNVISNVYVGIALNGFAAATPYTLYDHNNSIGQTGMNTISNFGGTSTAAYGIYATNQDLITIKNNSVSGGNGSTDRLAGILLQTGVSSTGEISYNTISVTTGATANKNTYGIWSLFGSTPALNTVSIHDNSVSCNTITAGSTGPLYGILCSAGPDTLRIYNNSFSGFNHVTNGTLTVIRSDGSANNVFINNNSIHDITATGTGAMTLIHNQSSVSATIYSNNLFDCNATGGSVYGIYTGSGTNATVYKNNLYNINSNNSNSASCLVYGINNTATTNITIYNNYISDLKANMATNNPAVCGLYLSGGTISNVYYNTIFLNATSSGTTFGSASAYIGSTVMTTLRNNIFVNESVPGATGYTAAIRRSGSTLLNNYAPASNNNDFYAGTPGANNLLYYDGTNAFQALAPFQALVTPAESVSFSELPPFVNIVTAPYDLHIKTGITTLCESGGSVISSPAINDDFDGHPRFPNTGYPDNPMQPATAPDAGADEFAGGPNTPSVTFTVDMSTAQGFNPASDVVYIAGGFPGASWNEPGTNQNLQLTRIGTTLNYSLTMSLAAGTYEYKYFKNAGWGGGEYNGGSNRSVTVTGNTLLNDTWGGSINWANLQWPGSGAINLGGAFDVYAQVYIANGITGAGGATYGLQAWIGFSTGNTNPDTWTNWVAAPYYGQTWDNDEFKANLGAAISTPGTYYYASRFQFGNGSYIYGGFSGGFWDGTTNISGVLTVSAAPPLAFNITGGGSYCEGGVGLLVGLDNSETGVDYQLYKDAVAFGPVVPGTGTIISFGYQTAGVYTATGTNGGATTPMNGSAVITSTAPLAVGVSIVASINPVPSGSTVTMTATPVNGGVTPSYQWKVNGINAGTDNPVFVYYPTHNDVVICVLTSSESCTSGNPATSNAITLKVIEEVITLKNKTVVNNETVCYNALQTINVAGNETSFTVEPGGSATMIAGMNILYFPGTTVMAGGYMHGYITLTGEYCANPSIPMVEAKSATVESSLTSAGSLFSVYPNPTSGSFTLDINGKTETPRVEVFDMQGGKLLQSELNGIGKYVLSLLGKPAGIYVIRVVSGNSAETVKLVKQ